MLKPLRRFVKVISLGGICAGLAASAAAQTTAKVTSVRLQVIPAKYVGPCPPRLQLSATITTNGPGTVWYTMGDALVAALGAGKLPEGTVSFGSAGSKTVTREMIFPPGTGTKSFNSAAAAEAAIEGPGGKHSNPTESNEADYAATCTGGSSPGPAGGGAPAAAPTVASAGQTGFVELMVTSPDGAPVAGAQVLVKGHHPVFTGSKGLTRLTLAPGTYIIDVDKRGVGAGFIRVTVRSGETINPHFQFRR